MSQLPVMVKFLTFYFSIFGFRWISLAMGSGSDLLHSLILCHFYFAFLGTQWFPPLVNIPLLWSAKFSGSLFLNWLQALKVFFIFKHVKWFISVIMRGDTHFIKHSMSNVAIVTQSLLHLQSPVHQRNITWGWPTQHQHCLVAASGEEATRAWRKTWRDLWWWPTPHGCQLWGQGVKGHW